MFARHSGAEADSRVGEEVNSLAIYQNFELLT